MVKPNEIVLRLYENKQCVMFTYKLIIDDEAGEHLDLTFKKQADDVWVMTMIYPKTLYAESQIYEIAIKLPKRSMPLEKIASFGITAIREYLNNEISEKQRIIYAVGQQNE